MMIFHSTRCIAELEALATAAAQFEIRRSTLFINADPSMKLWLQSEDDLDAVELTDFVIAARRLAATLRREEAEAVLHLDGAS